ncbi:MAG: ribonuclease PH [Candidatus Omnitrophica bacterium]|nr:ribonuclease PH [Candidatus Omnitrophota bacterium]
MRLGGRKETQIREVKIKRNYIDWAEGSCLIELGKTRVICTASLEESVPQFLRGSGRGWVTAEYGMLPRSCQTRIFRSRDSGRSHEIQRLIGRSLRAITLMERLGERTIWIDCDVIQADGGTRTAAITGGFIALVDALSKLKARGIIYEIPIEDFIAAISVGIVNKRVFVDLTYEEDSSAEVDMNVVMTGKGEFVEIQGTGEKSTFNKKEMEMLIDLAKARIEDLINLQRQLLKDILFI